MLAVTHYHTSFLKLNSKRMVPCFALGVDMHVDSMIRIPPIHKLVIEFSETGERDKIGQAPPHSGYGGQMGQNSVWSA